MKETLTSCIGWFVCTEDGEETRFMKPSRRRQSNATTTTTTNVNNTKQDLMVYYLLLEQFQPDFVYDNVFKWFSHDEILNCLSHVCKYFRQICCCYLPVHIRYDSHLDEKNNAIISMMRKSGNATAVVKENSEGNVECEETVHKETIAQPQHLGLDESLQLENLKSYLPFKKVVKLSIIGNPIFRQIPTIDNWKYLRILHFNVHYYSNVIEMSNILDQFFENIEKQQKFKQLKQLTLENLFNLNDNTELTVKSIVTMMNTKNVIRIPTITCMIPTKINVLLKHFHFESLILGSLFNIHWKKVSGDLCLKRFRCQVTMKNLNKFEKLITHEKFKVERLEIHSNSCFTSQLGGLIDILNRTSIRQVVFLESNDAMSLFKVINSQPTLENSEIIITDPVCIKLSDFMACKFTSRIYSICISIETQQELSELIEMLKRLPKMELLCVVCENDHVFSYAKNEFTNSNKLNLSNILFYRRASNSDSDNVIGASKLNFDKFQKINKRKNESQFLKENCILLDLKFKRCKPYFPYLKIMP